MALTSFYGQLLLKIQDFVKEKLPEIRYCDQDLGQLDHYQDRPAVSFPCLLVDFTGTNYDQMMQMEEMGTAQLTLKLGFAPFSSANSLGPIEVKEKALQYYEFENILYQTFKGYSADEMMQPLNRKQDGTQKRDDVYRVRIIIFETSFFDDGAVPERDLVDRPIMDFEPQ
jgi:hypothetical protein